MTELRCFGLALVLLLWSLPAAADGDAGGDPASGGEIADRLCARCHAIGPEGASPAERAPPFRTLGQRYPLGHLEEAMAEGLVVGHSDPPMPAFEFRPEEIEDLIAYLESLSGF